MGDLSLPGTAFEFFLAVWTAAHIAALIWLRAGWFLIVPGLNDDVLRGNISTFLALFAVLAIERSAAWWAPALLTKITPAVGLVWHAMRREWRSLASCAVVTGAIVAVGVLIAPDLWRDWVTTLLNGESTYEIGHPLGSAVAAGRDRRDRRGVWSSHEPRVARAHRDVPGSPGSVGVQRALLAGIPGC